MVGVVAHEGGHVEGRRQAGPAGAEQVLEPRVRVLGGAEAGEHAHGPEPGAVHRCVDATGVGVRAGVGPVAVDALDGHAGHRLEGDVAAAARRWRCPPVAPGVLGRRPPTRSPDTFWDVQSRTSSEHRPEHVAVPIDLVAEAAELGGARAGPPRRWSWSSSSRARTRSCWRIDAALAAFSGHPLPLRGARPWPSFSRRGAARWADRGPAPGPPTSVTNTADRSARRPGPPLGLDGDGDGARGDHPGTAWSRPLPPPPPPRPTSASAVTEDARTRARRARCFRREPGLDMVAPNGASGRPMQRLRMDHATVRLTVRRLWGRFERDLREWLETPRGGSPPGGPGPGVLRTPQRGAEAARPGLLAPRALQGDDDPDQGRGLPGSRRRGPLPPLPEHKMEWLAAKGERTRSSRATSSTSRGCATRPSSSSRAAGST